MTHPQQVQLFSTRNDGVIFVEEQIPNFEETKIKQSLFRIKENPKAFVVPIIDVIDDKTLEYYHGNGNYFQVFKDKTNLVNLKQNENNEN